MVDYKKFFGEGWAQQLSPLFASKEYKFIGTYLQNLEQDGVKVTPSLKHVFRAFLECPWYSLHSIIIGLDPYPGVNPDGSLIADGLAFSARESEDAPKSLNAIYEAIDTTVFNGEYTPRGSWHYENGFIAHGLMHWARNGVLLLNCALTTELDGSNKHLNLWRPFIEYVIHDICKTRDSLGVILMGTEARDLNKLVVKNSTCQVFQCEHPYTASFSKRSWNHNDVFADLTQFQKRTNNIKIDW